MSMYQSQLISIENFDYRNPNQRINSPRTLEACGKLGLDPKQLYYLDLNQYKVANPEVFALPKDIQKIRWEHSNKMREKHLESVVMERRKIIENEYLEMKDKKNFENNLNTVGNQPSITLSNSNSNFRSSNHINRNTAILGKTLSSSVHLKSTAIEREMQKLEKMKEKQKDEIQNYVENELRAQFLRLENEERLLLLKQRQEEHRREIARRNRIRDMEKNKREFFLERRTINELEDKQRLMEEKEFEQQRLLYAQQVEDKMKQRDFLKKEEDNRKRLEEIRLNNDRITMEEKLKADERKRRMLEKEHERKIIIEKQRLEKMLEKQKAKLHKQKKLDQARINLEEKLKREDREMLRKQLMSEEKRNQFEEMRQTNLKKKNEEAMKKQEEIQKTVNKCRELEENKIFEFNKKMEEMEKQKKIVGKMKEDQLAKKQIEAKNRELKIIQTREEKEKLDNLRNDFVIAKITQTDFKIKKLKEAKETELMKKNEQNTLLRTEREMNIKRIENIKEYERLKQMEKLEGNYRKAEEFMDTKILIGEKKKEINMEIAIQKKNIVGKLDEYLVQHKDLSPEALKELFPKDEQLYQRALAIKEQMSLSKSQFRSVIKSRESIKTLTNPNIFKTEAGNTKNNFFISAENSDQVKKMGFDKNNPNYSSDLNEKKDEGKSSKSGFGPVIDIANSDDVEDSKQLNNVLSIKPEVFNYNQKLTAKEIEKMVHDYRGKLNAEMLKILNEEKNKEEQRDIMYTSITVSTEKKRLEKMISVERNRSSAKILKINEEFEKKVREYYLSLKKHLVDN